MKVVTTVDVDVQDMHLNDPRVEGINPAYPEDVGRHYESYIGELQDAINAGDADNFQVQSVDFIKVL